MTERLTITQWAEEDRPREKMMIHGASALSNAELLAILIGSGNAEESAVELMRKILNDYHNNLNELGKASIEELCRYKGIGSAKAISILAASELGKRRKEESVKERTTIVSSKDVYACFYPQMCDLPIEECWLLLLNRASKIIDKVKVSAGGLTATAVDVRCILREAIMKRASAIVLCHNHPSGNIRPSREDDLLTKLLARASECMDIRLIDHIILVDGAFYSYADEGRI